MKLKKIIKDDPFTFHNATCLLIGLLMVAVSEGVEPFATVGLTLLIVLLQYIKNKYITIA